MNKSIARVAGAVFLLTLLSGCGDEISSAASEYCGCVEPLYAEMGKARAAREEGDVGKVITLAKDISEKQPQVMACVKKLRKKYGGRGAEFEKQVQQQVDRRCPKQHV
ncbi:MAG: hypothetical protein LJE84_11875 [Gammaproteobacteria bacterium]|nr:hypothetical protein [Gammaproteobacteria bacterium]